MDRDGRPLLALRPRRGPGSRLKTVATRSFRCATAVKRFLQIRVLASIQPVQQGNLVN